MVIYFIGVFFDVCCQKILSFGGVGFSNIIPSNVVFGFFKKEEEKKISSSFVSFLGRCSLGKNVFIRSKTEHKTVIRSKEDRR